MSNKDYAKEYGRGRNFKRKNRRSKKTVYFEKKIDGVKIIPLGGLDEVGKNITVVEYKQDMIIIDCGIAFPDNEMLGVDIVIPDFSYVIENKNKLRGIVLTHGHEDHIGALSYLLKSLGAVPIYGAMLTLGLVEGKLKEHKVFYRDILHVVQPGDVITFGDIGAEFISVNHSIPDACGLAITTPAGVIVHTGDFKIDYTPINGNVINLSRFADLGEKGVLALLSDSTNSERRGMTNSESKVRESLEVLFKRAGDRRIIIATFASNIHRIQQILDIAVKYGRKVVVSGHSMELVVNKAIELGYLNFSEKNIVPINKIKYYSDEQLVVITTGSQGEPMSALKRMSTGEHRKVYITNNDFIIISATPIPGNEKFVNRVINELMKLGAQVIYEDMYDVHVSGHACQSEQQLIINLVKPQYFLPVHGEYKHLRRHAETAVNMGIKAENIYIAQIGDVIELSSQRMEITGKVAAGNVMVDGLGVGDVGSTVLKDRKHLSEDGLIVIAAVISRQSRRVVSGPEIVSKGFIYVKEAEDLVNEVKAKATKILNNCLSENISDWSLIKSQIRERISSYLYSKTKRRPMALVLIQDVDG